MRKQERTFKDSLPIMGHVGCFKCGYENGIIYPVSLGGPGYGEYWCKNCSPKWAKRLFVAMTLDNIRKFKNREDIPNMGIKFKKTVQIKGGNRKER